MKKITLFLFIVFFVQFTHAATSRNTAIANQVLNFPANVADVSISNVASRNGSVAANVSQRVTAGGSVADVAVDVFINPADKNLAARALASSLPKAIAGGLGAAALGYGIDKLLDGVGYLIDHGAIVKKINDTSCDFSSSACPSYQYYWEYAGKHYASPDCVAAVGKSNWWGDTVSTSVSVDQVNCTGSTSSQLLASFLRKSNPAYDSSVPPPAPPPAPTKQEMTDAFGDWLKNNPTSLTDPVITYAYTPKGPDGYTPVPSQLQPSWGDQTITDDMMHNYLANRDAEAYAKWFNSQNQLQDQAVEDSVPNDATRTTTKTNPDGSKTTTKVNPDGTKEIVTTTTVTNPDGSQTTTTSTTKTDKDGNPISQSSEKTDSTQTKTNTDIPPACEYFATLCDWLNWTKSNDSVDDNPDLDQKPIETPDLQENFINFGGSCPADEHINFSLYGQSASIALSWQPTCQLLSYLYYPILCCAYISAAFIVVGASKS